MFANVLDIVHLETSISISIYILRGLVSPLTRLRRRPHRNSLSLLYSLAGPCRHCSLSAQVIQPLFGIRRATFSIGVLRVPSEYGSNFDKMNSLRVAAEYQVLGTSCACLLERQKYGPGISLLAGQTQFPSRSSTLVNGICSGGHNKYSSMLVSPLSHISLAYS